MSNFLFNNFDIELAWWPRRQLLPCLDHLTFPSSAMSIISSRSSSVSSLSSSAILIFAIFSSQSSLCHLFKNIHYSEKISVAVTYMLEFIFVESNCDVNYNVFCFQQGGGVAAPSSVVSSGSSKQSTNDPGSRMSPTQTQQMKKKTRTKRQSGTVSGNLPSPMSPGLSRDSSDDINVGGVSFRYSLSSSTKYNILLDQTSNMGINMRWTNVKRSLFR